MFAAWPLVYAAAFSGFYVMLLLVLFALFFRPVGFDYRSKRDDPRWRAAWDWALFGAGTLPPILFGVAFGNLLQGVPFYFDSDLRSFYTGNFLALFNPFALLCGAIGLAMLVAHGAAFLRVKTEGVLAVRAGVAVRIATLITVVLFVVAGWRIATTVTGFQLSYPAPPNSVANPLLKGVDSGAGLWLMNYARYPWMMLAPLGVLASGLGAALFASSRWPRLGFAATGTQLVGIILTAAFSMFPFIVPSSIDGRSSLTVWDSTSSQGTLQIMLVAIVTLLPLILFYTRWVYRVMRGKVTLASLERNSHTMY
jgi:cytochrome d ubiquinol oxidase subunit II